MSHLSLPIPVSIPLDVLAKPTEGIVDALLPELRERSHPHPHPSYVENRIAECGITQIWMLMLYQPSVLLRRRGWGKKTLDLAEEILQKIGGKFQQFPALTEALENVVNEARKRPFKNTSVDFPRVVWVLTGTEPPESEPAIVAALKKYGLRPGMRLEELFEYVPPKAEFEAILEPKERTVAEELLAFGAMKAWSVVSPSDFELELNPDRTIIELLAELAVWPEPADPPIGKRRADLIAAARRHLSPEALMRIGYAEE